MNPKKFSFISLRMEDPEEDGESIEILLPIRDIQSVVSTGLRTSCIELRNGQNDIDVLHSVGQIFQKIKKA